MSAEHILKLAILFKNAVFDHKPEEMCCGGTMVRKDCPYHKDQHHSKSITRCMYDANTKELVLPTKPVKGQKLIFIRPPGAPIGDDDDEDPGMVVHDVWEDEKGFKFFSAFIAGANHHYADAYKYRIERS